MQAEGFYVNEPMTLAGIEPETFRFVAQRLNRCATAEPSHVLKLPLNSGKNCISTVAVIQLQVLIL